MPTAIPPLPIIVNVTDALLAGLLQSFSSTTPGTFPLLTSSQGIPTKFRPVTPTGGGGPPWQDIDTTGATVKLSIGTPGLDPLVETTAFTRDADTVSFDGTVYLATDAMLAAFTYANALTLAVWLQIDITFSGASAPQTVLKIPVNIDRSVIAAGAIASSGNAVTADATTHALTSPTASQFYAANPPPSSTGAVASVNGHTGTVVLSAADLGLGNVTNTSDASKPVSTAQQTALNLKLDAASFTFGGLAGKPTTLGGYGITDALTATQTTSAISTAIGNLTAGSPTQLDTFLEAYNRFLADESAASALTATVAGKLTATSNLSDLANAATARTNLGLGASATLNVGMTTGTVAAGDDSRITGAAADSTVVHLSGAEHVTGSKTLDSLTATSAVFPNGATLNSNALTANSPGVIATQQGVSVAVAAEASARSNNDATVQAYAIQRANHTGTQTLSTISDAGNAASRNVGTASGTVAAGDDSRITTTAQTVQQLISGTALQYGANVAIDFAGSGVQFVALTGDIRLSTYDLAPGRTVTLYLDGDTVDHNLILPAWRAFVAAPTVVPAGKTLQITLICRGTTDADVSADYTLSAAASSVPLARVTSTAVYRAAYTYTPAYTDGGNNWGYCALWGGKLAAGSNGYLSQKFVTGSQFGMIGFRTTQAQGSYPTFILAFWLNGSNGVVVIDGGGFAAGGGSVGSVAVGDIVRLNASTRSTSPVYKIQKSSDGGTTWVDLYTLTYAGNVDLYPVSDIRGDGNLSDPRGFGLTAAPLVSSQDLFAGDSLTTGIGTTGTTSSASGPSAIGPNTYPKQTFALLANSSDALLVKGYPGQTASWFNTNKLAETISQYDTTKTRVVVVVFFGANDELNASSTQIISDLRATHKALRKAGAITVAVQLLNRKDAYSNANNNATRLAVNAALLADPTIYDAISATPASIYADTAPDNATYFNPADVDGLSKVHLTDAGAGVLAAAVRAAIATL